MTAGIEKESKIGLVILAAGNSSRLGEPKQLIMFRGQTLLQRIVSEALKSLCRPIVVVLGEKTEEIKEHLSNADVKIIKNENWQQGMGSSISCGVEEIIKLDDQLMGIVLCVCDQPFVTSAVIDELMEVYGCKNSKIVASSYAETLGVPALFDKSLFGNLINLREKSGAKNIIEEFSKETVAIDFPEGNFDLDTQEDLHRLREMA